MNAKIQIYELYIHTKIVNLTSPTSIAFFAIPASPIQIMPAEFNNFMSTLDSFGRILIGN